MTFWTALNKATEVAGWRAALGSQGHHEYLARWNAGAGGLALFWRIAGTGDEWKPLLTTVVPLAEWMPAVEAR